MLFYGRVLIFLVAGISIIFSAIFLMLLMPRHPWPPHWATRTFAHMGLRVFGIKLEVRGREYLRDGGPYVVISNHQHGVDVLIMGTLMPMKTVTLGKTALLFIPFFGVAYWLAGNILVNRSDREKARQSMGKVNRAILEDKKSIWIMPEGTRSQGRAILLPFKKGAFVTAAKTDAPLVCVCVAPYWGRLNWNKWKSGIVAVEILPPVSVGINSVGKTMEGVHERMKKKIEDLA